ncbi:hypothetical protein BTHE68_70630 (plasmid) [Burkholderia sp. THE68]|nr:hypothetical protein BTHE68_70630 [Burkholderia sp. THE68]
MRAPYVGSSNERYRKNERMAVRRRLRVQTLTPRAISKSARNVLMYGASRSSRVKAEGGLRSFVWANLSNSRNVSLYDAIVLLLALRCCISRIVK